MAKVKSPERIAATKNTAAAMLSNKKTVKNKTSDRKRITLYLSEDEYDKLKKLSQIRTCSMNEFMVSLLKKEAERPENNKALELLTKARKQMKMDV